MTILEFMVEFKKVAHLFNIYEGGLIREETRASCPITTVVRKLKKQTCQIYMYVSAGKAIGLTIDDIKTIVQTADNSKYSAFYDESLRKEMVNLLQKGA